MVYTCVWTRLFDSLSSDTVHFFLNICADGLGRLIEHWSLKNWAFTHRRTKKKFSLRNCSQPLGHSKSVLRFASKIYLQISLCAAGEENSFALEWSKLGKICCHLLKIKQKQVLICSFNESLVLCMWLCILLYGLLLWGQILTAYCKIVLIYY